MIWLASIHDTKDMFVFVTFVYIMSRTCASFLVYLRHWTYSMVAKYRLWRHTLENEKKNDVIKWKHFLRYWPFVRGIHRSPVNSQHKGQWRGAFMFSLICAWINGWVNNGEAGDLRCHRAHYDDTVMKASVDVHHIQSYDSVCRVCVG